MTRKTSLRLDQTLKFGAQLGSHRREVNILLLYTLSSLMFFLLRLPSAVLFLISKYFLMRSGFDHPFPSSTSSSRHTGETLASHLLGFDRERIPTGVRAHDVRHYSSKYMGVRGFTRIPTETPGRQTVSKDIQSAVTAVIPSIDTVICTVFLVC